MDPTLPLSPLLVEKVPVKSLPPTVAGRPSLLQKEEASVLGTRVCESNEQEVEATEAAAAEESWQKADAIHIRLKK